MKRPIRKQLTITFTLIFAVLILVFILTNILLMKNFFSMSKYRTMHQAYAQINSSAKTNSFDSHEFRLSFRLICEKYNLTGLVIDQDGESIVSYQGSAMLMQAYTENPEAINAKTVRQIKNRENETYSIIYDPQSDSEYIEMRGNFESGEKVVLRTSMKGIENNVRTSNFFIAWAAILAILVGILAIGMASKKITKPIRELTELSEKMTDMDFDAKYQGSSNDEVDRLGENMNILSAKLEQTIHELKDANAELKEDIEKKEKLESLQKEFIANASHELKTPIALIQGYAEGLKENVNDDPESRAFYCDVIMEESAKMNELVRMLMNLNELEMGYQTISVDRFNLSEMIENQIQTMSLPAVNNGITITYEPKDIFVNSDVFKVEEVFRNYLSNAINHCSGEKKIEIKTTENQNKIRVEVYNTGNRIPEDEIPKIWDRFYKVDKARTHEYGGSGVGLSIVKATMELLEGDYGCINTDSGVCFYFELMSEKKGETDEL